MQRQHSIKPATKPSRLPKLITLGLVMVIIIFAVSLLPKGFSGDISLIGKGTPVLVLVHDDNILQSGETMVVMNQIRNDYATRLELVVADINTPEGRTFANANGLMATALVFYSANGQHVKTLYAAQTAESLRQELDSIF
ncbi:MAG: hypothetical protein H6937_01705 [Burkholderiales bacterium]|nr:hypothetical protein [Burkholderiales bacterium]MDR4517869.1 hypothetical protein [Nitrosomonas sp.]